MSEKDKIKALIQYLDVKLKVKYKKNEVVEEKSLKKFLKELTEDPKDYQAYYQLDKEDWIRLYGDEAVFVYNHLHPGI